MRPTSPFRPAAPLFRALPLLLVLLLVPLFAALAAGWIPDVPAARPAQDWAGPGLAGALPDGWSARATGPRSARWSLPDGSRVDVFVQPLDGKSLAEYIGYTGRYLGERPVPHLEPIDPAPGGGPRRRGWVELAWRRTPAGAADLSVSHLIHIPAGEVAWTLVLRTRPEAYDGLRPAFRQAAASLAPDPDAGGAVPAPGAAEPPLPDANAVLAAHRSPGQSLRVELPPAGLMWGLFDGNAPFAWEPLAAREKRLGHRFGLIMTYRDWSADFPLAEARAAADQGRLLMLTWQPWHQGQLTEPLLIPEIAAGALDAYIRRFARDVAAFGEPILLRFANEMNGDWDPWSAWFYGLDHELYVQAWRRVYDIFQAEGATNAMWVWNPHDRSYPNFTWNDPHLYYPGDAYVDWVGLTGYNTGPRAGDPWRSFDQIYGPVYAEYRRLYPDKPLLITEFASDDEGGDKAAWISDMMAALPRYPAIRMAVWFDFPWWQWDYPLDSSPEALAAFARGLRQPYYNAGLAGTP